MLCHHHASYMADTVAESQQEPVLAPVLGDVPRGSIRRLRVIQLFPKTTNVANRPPIGLAGEENARAVLGTVPVEPDGSARFIVPARTPILFQALDEDFMEIQRMRTFVNFRPGEQRSCIGCHERRTRPPSARQNTMPLALLDDPVAPGPQPGDVAPRPLHYEADVQPIFNANCASAACHGSGESAGLRLTSGSSHGNLVNVSSTQVVSLKRVLPNDPDNSYLVQKLGANPDVGLQMPRGQNPLSSADVTTIRDWIEDGALND